MVDRGVLHGQTLNDAINMRTRTHVHVRVHIRGRCTSACGTARRKELFLLGLYPKRKMSGTSGKIISMK